MYVTILHWLNLKPKHRHLTHPATSSAMMDALLRILQEEADSCLFHGLITGASSSVIDVSEPEEFDPSRIRPDAHLNDSQIKAVSSWRSPLSLIWGPPGMLQSCQRSLDIYVHSPGTGKTTVIVQILRDILMSHEIKPKILMTASTHNGEII